MKYWIAVASREHVLKGKKEGFMQVCHGKKRPLERLAGDDWIIYYSPTNFFGEKDPCRKFTAIGRIKNKDSYQCKMNDGFIPWRKDVDFLENNEVEIAPLINDLSFIKNKKQWGFIFRYGLFSIPFEDFKLIVSRMGIDINN
jgi:hypothetical protein